MTNQNLIGLEIDYHMLNLPDDALREIANSVEGMLDLEHAKTRGDRFSALSLRADLRVLQISNIALSMRVNRLSDFIRGLERKE